MLVPTCNIPSGNSYPEGVILSAGQVYVCSADCTWCIGRDCGYGGQNLHMWLLNS